MTTGMPGWSVSRRTGWRTLWGGLAALIFGAATVSAVLGLVNAPQVDSAVLVLIAVPFLVMALVLAWDGITQGFVHMDAAGYRTPGGRLRPWTKVLAVGVGEVDGRIVPVVALHAEDESFPITQEVFPGFAEIEAPRLVSALRAFCGEGSGFAGVVVPNQWWQDAEAEADRVVAVVRDDCGRMPVSRDRVEFGLPILSAVRLDYGQNDDGDRVEVFCRRTSDLSFSSRGRRWLRQNRKRSADPATQVSMLFGAHTVIEKPNRGAGFDRVVVVPEAGKPLPFNAEEPDRFADVS